MVSTVTAKKKKQKKEEESQTMSEYNFLKGRSWLIFAVPLKTFRRFATLSKAPVMKKGLGMRQSHFCSFTSNKIKANFQTMGAHHTKSPAL